jgi:two-component system cell cycle response regulator
MAEQDKSPQFQQFDAQTARYDASPFQKYRLDRKIPTLQVLAGSDAGLRIPLIKDEVTLGRTVDADIVFPDEKISRRHARICFEPENGSYHLIDLGSTNGTFLNDKPVSRSPLSDGDKIFLGTTILKFMMQDQVESESGELVDRFLFKDDLTGLVVKRRFYNQLNIRLQEAASRKQPLSVLMMDMDGLKRVNDTHGHWMGAFVIGEAGKRIGEICNARGEACRYGGDEFVAYICDGKQAAFAVAESILEAIRGSPFEKDGVSVALTISIGLSVFPEAGSNLDALTRCADEALYRAKAKGRNTASD